MGTLLEGRRKGSSSSPHEVRASLPGEPARIRGATLRAVALFRTAAKREALTVDLAERMVWYLYRAQYDPKLKLEG